MKTAVTITAATLLVSFGLTENGHCQTYQTVSTFPGFGVKFADGAGPTSNSFDVVSSGSFNISNNITVNAGAGTIEDQGSFYLPSAAGSSVFHESMQVITGAVFPNPPTTNTVTGDLTVNAVFAGGPFQFDTGPRGLSYVGRTPLGPNTWKFGGTTFIDMPVEVSYSFATGGQTYSGTVDQNLQFFYDFGSLLEISDFPATLNLGGSEYQETVANIAGVTAADGLSVGIVAIVPEPSSFALCGICVAAFVFSRRRNK